MRRLPIIRLGHFDKAHCAHLGGVVAESKFVDVAIQVLGAHVMIDADIAALEQRPKALDAIGVRHVEDVLACRVVHADMLVASTL